MAATAPTAAAADDFDWSSAQFQRGGNVIPAAAPPGNADDFDWSNAKFSRAPQRSAIGEIASQAKAGVYEAAQGLGGALQGQAEMTGAEPGPISKAGQAIEQWGEEGLKNPDLQPQATGVTGFVAKGVRQVIASAPAAAAAIGGGVVGSLVAPGVGTAAGAAAGGGWEAGAQAYHQKYHEALDAGKSEDEARSLAGQSALLQGAAMGLVSGVAPEAGGLVGKFTGAGATTAAEAAADVTGKQFLPEAAKGFAGATTTNVVTMPATAAAQAAIDQAHGIQTQTPWEAAKAAVPDALAMSVALSPLVAMAAHATARRSAAIGRALDDPAVSPTARAAAVSHVADAMKPVDPGAATTFTINASEAIAQGKPIGFDPAWTDGPHPDLFPSPDFTVDTQGNARPTEPAATGQSTPAPEEAPTQPMQGPASAGPTAQVPPAGDQQSPLQPLDPVTRQNALDAAAQPDAGPLTRSAGLAIQNGATDVLLGQDRSPGKLPAEGDLALGAEGSGSSGAGSGLAGPGFFDDLIPSGAAASPSAKAIMFDDLLPANSSADSDQARADLDAAAHEAATSPRNDLPEPTDAQKEAGNFQMGHADIQGLPVTIEHPAGTVRKEGFEPLAAHYGYIKGTEGNDGEHVDTFVGPNPDSDKAFIVDQANKDGDFDEHKVMLGFDDQASAEAAYRASYPPDFEMGPITETSIDGLKDWLKNGDTTEPFSEQAESGKSAETSIQSAGVPSLAIHEVPVSELKLSDEVPQFKSGADKEGVVEPLGGKFDRRGVGPIQVWQRTNGDLEVISGRHRLDLARRSGEETIPAQVHREADGFTAKDAAALDAELNIRDEQGSVGDYAQYFKASGLPQEAAESRGLLARAKGKNGFAIARDGSPPLIAAHRAGELSDEAARQISGAAPGDERLQAVGMKSVQDGKPIVVATNTMRAVRLMADERKAAGAQGDIFGFDDSGMREAEAMARAAAKEQRALTEQIAAVQGAAKRPDQARKLGVDVKDPEGIKRRIMELRTEAARWDNWSQHPDLVEKIRSGGLEVAEERPDYKLEGETNQQALAREKREEAARKKAEADARAALEQERKDRERKEIEQRAGKSDFRLGATSDEDLAGQGRLFEPKGKRDEYTTDLFGNPLQAGRGKDRNSGPGDASGNRDVHAAPALQEKFATEVRPVKKGSVALGYERITNAQQAAHAFGALRKASREHFAVLVVDKDGKPLTYLPLFSGAEASTSVHPDIVAKAVYQTKGAAGIWLAHNHPSGLAEPSRADRLMTEQIGKSFGKDLGVTLEGHVIIAGRRAVELDAAGNKRGPAFDISPAVRKFQVPITERELFRQEKLGSAITQATAPRAVNELLGGKTGIVFVDSQMRPIATREMTPQQMLSLRSGDAASGYGALMDAAGRAGSNRVFLNLRKQDFENAGGLLGAESAARNIGTALKATYMELVDGIYDGKSFAAAGKSLGSQSGQFFKRGGIEVGEATHEEFATADRIGQLRAQVNNLTKTWKNAPDIKIVQSVDDLPFPAYGDVRGAYHRGTAYLVADNLRTPEDAQFVLFHETLGHAGLRGLLGDELDRSLMAIDAKNRNVHVEAARYMMQYGVKRTIAIEETLADMAGRGETFDGFKQLMAAIQEGLRKIGLDKVADWLESRTDAEAMQLLSRSRSFIEDEPHRTTGDMLKSLKNSAAFSRAGGTIADRVSATFGKVGDYAKELKDAYTRAPKVTESKTIIGKYTGALQRIDFELAKVARDINRSMPRDRQEAVVNYMQHAGDEKKLAELAASAPAKYRKGYLDAMQLTPEEKAAAAGFRDRLDGLFKTAQDAGVIEDYVTNYVRQEWEKPDVAGKKIFAQANSGAFSTNAREAMGRIFQDYAEGERAGYTPTNKTIGYQMVAAERSIRSAIEARKALAALLNSKENDGRPTVAVGGAGSQIEGKEDSPYLVKPNATGKDTTDYRYMNHPAMRNWKWVGSDTEGKPILLQGNMWVHPDAYGRLNALLGRSKIRDYTVPEHVPIIGGTQPGRAALEAGAFIKGTVLLGPFHQFHLAEHAIFHKVNPFGTPEIDFDKRPLLREGVDHGLMLFNHNAMHEFGEGLASGGLLHRVPILGEQLQRYQSWLFQDFIPRLKATMFEHAVQRAEQYYAKDLASGKFTRDQLLENAAKQANAAFGEQNYRYIGRDPTLQDALRLALLAPDFLESRLKFFAQAARPKGKEQLMALVRGAVIMSAAAQTINTLFGDDKKPHWDKPFSAIIGGREYLPRSVVGDMMHLITDPRSFWYHRLNPLWGTPLLELSSGRNQYGQKVGVDEAAHDIGQSWVPILGQGFFKKAMGDTPAGSIVSSLLQSIGVTNFAFKTPAERAAADITFSHMKMAATSPAEKARHEAFMGLMDDYKAGKLATMSDVIAEARKQGMVLTPEQRKQLILSREEGKKGEQDAMRNRMQSFSVDEVMSVWREMDQEEKDAYRSFVRGKIARAKSVTPEDRRSMLSQLAG